MNLCAFQASLNQHVDQPGSQLLCNPGMKKDKRNHFEQRRQVAGQSLERDFLSVRSRKGLRLFLKLDKFGFWSRQLHLRVCACVCLCENEREREMSLSRICTNTKPTRRLCRRETEQC